MLQVTPIWGTTLADKKLSLAELMGKGAENGLSLSRLHEVLGEGTPELPRNAVGRHRLIRALGQRFGPNWRSLPHTSDLLKQFDSEVEHQRSIMRIRNIRYGGTR